MSETVSHTPGPWDVVKDIDIVGGETGFARVYKDDSVIVDDYLGIEDANLIAAAPDMLDSLDPETLVAIANEIMGDFKHTARADSLRLIAARQFAARSKAEGR